MAEGMAKAHTNIATEMNLKGNGKMIKNKWVNIFSVQGINLKVSSNQAKWPSVQ